MQVRSRSAKLREGPMALPENKPPKSITSKTLVRFSSIDLKFHVHPIGFVNIRARGSIHLKRRIDAAPSEVDAIQDLLAVLKNPEALGSVGSPSKVEWEARIVLNAASDPEARRNLIANAAANGIPLILRVRKMAGGRYPRLLRHRRGKDLP